MACLPAGQHADILRGKEWMGHADVETTMKYLHFAPGPVDAAIVAEAFAVDVPAAAPRVAPRPCRLGARPRQTPRPTADGMTPHGGINITDPD